MRSVRSAVAVAGLVASGLVTGGSVPLLGTLTAAGAAAVPSCVPAQIKVSHGAPQGTASTTYIPLIFTNHGPACAIWGVPTIQPVTGSTNRSVGPMARTLSIGEMPVRQVVATGHTVSAAFGVVDTGNFSPSSCVARSASGVLVALGSFVNKTYVRLPITVCTKRAGVTTRLIVPGVNGY